MGGQCLVWSMAYAEGILLSHELRRVAYCSVRLFSLELWNTASFGACHIALTMAMTMVFE